MLPILDFFYGLVPSYGLAIVALTLVIRFALWPLSAGSIRNARRMKIANPVLQERQRQVKEKYKDDPAKQQEELGKLFKEFGNPLSGCLPLVFQMPILFALFATLRGSPFTDIPYTFNLQILPQDQIERVDTKPLTTKLQNVYVDDGVHFQIIGIMPTGSRLLVGETAQPQFQTEAGQPLADLSAAYPGHNLTPYFEVTKGAERIDLHEDGSFEALQPGDVVFQARVPGLASNTGFLFIKALGQVGVVAEDGTINWDILSMVLCFGISLFISQSLSGQGSSGNPQQDSINKITPVMISGMFLFFPLPAGVLMYMVLANFFQTGQTLILAREPLPENLQKIVDAEQKKAEGETRLPFEPVGAKKGKESGEPNEESPVTVDVVAKKVEPKKSIKPMAASSAEGGIGFPFNFGNKADGASDSKVGSGGSAGVPFSTTTTPSKSQNTKSQNSSSSKTSSKRRTKKRKKA